MTQTELNRLLAAVAAEAKRAGIPVSSRVCPTVQINRRAKSRFGCCRRAGDDFTVEIAASLLEAEERAVRQVLAHELLHTCPGCSNHGTQWKIWASLMNRVYGYRIRRTNSPGELGLTDDRLARWLIVCRKCGSRSTRMKRSPLVEHPERYRCRCGGTLEVKELT